MPKINLNAPMGFIIKKMDEYIASGSYPSAEDLAEKLEKGVATIHRYRKYMIKEMNAPIKNDKKRGGYYYTIKGYRLPTIFASAEDLLAIEFIKELTELYRGTPLHEEVNSLLKTIAVPEDLKDNAKWYKDRIIVPKTITVPVDSGVWQSILTGLKENRVIKFKYFGIERKFAKRKNRKKPKEEVYICTIHPYQLMFDRTAWFLTGYSEDTKRKHIFYVSRISCVSVTDKKFTFDKNFDYRNFQGKSYFGIFGSKNVHKFVIEIFGNTRWIRERKWADDQVIEETKNGIRLSFSSNQPGGVLSWLIGMGPRARPLEPAPLVKKWKSVINEMNKLAKEPLKKKASVKKKK